MFKPNRTAARRVAGLVVDTIVVVCLLSIICLFAVPRVMGWDLVVVLSGSMEPALPVGSVLSVQPTPPEQIKIGDILTHRITDETGQFRKGEVVQITHRVIEVLNGPSGLAFRTKGDANDAPDSYTVAQNQVVGTVQWCIPYAGYMASALRTKEGFLAMIAIPGLVLILGEVRTIVREVRNLRARRKSSQEAQP